MDIINIYTMIQFDQLVTPQNSIPIILSWIAVIVSLCHNVCLVFIQ